MKLIKKLEEMIDDEISDIEKYAKMAAAVKDENPSLAQVLYSISAQEDSHQALLHSEVVKIIENHRRLHGEPPAAMMAVYEYLHEQHIKKLTEARQYQNVYKDM